MKLRTVLSELRATAHIDGVGVDVDADVIVLPVQEIEDPIPEQLVLLPSAHMVNRDFPGLSLVYAGDRIADSEARPQERVSLFASPLSFDEVKETFERLPKLHVHLDLQRKRLFRAFQASYDIQRFADQAYQILGNPLMIVNSDRRLLASAGEFPENRADVLEEINLGYVSEEVNAEMEAAGILDDVRHAGHSIISENERFGQRWVTSVITYHHMEMGRFDMLELGHTVSDIDLELVDFAGSLAGVLIDKFGIAGKRAGSGSSVLDDILSNTLANEKTMRAQLAASSMPLDDTYVLMELVGEREIPRAHLQRIALRMSNAFRYSLWTTRDGRLVVFVAIGPRTNAGWDCYERAERVMGSRREFLVTLERNGLTAYVGEPFEQLGLAPARFKQVLDLVSSGIEDAGPVVYFWNHRYTVLATLAQTFAQADMMLDKRVVAMSVYDRDHGTQYLETACRTVEFPGSPAEAAKALNVHRNTYFYRVNKIAEIFYLDLRNGQDRLAVAFSTHVLSGMGGNVLFDTSQMPDLWRHAIGTRHLTSPDRD